MTKRLIHLVLIVGMAALGGTLALAKDPPKKTVIKACAKKQPGVAFDHEAHTKKQKIECKTCHHTGKNESCSTAKCHAGKAEGKRPGCEEMSLTKNPFHVTCIGCHKKGEGPKKCKECHKKE